MICPGHNKLDPHLDYWAWIINHKGQIEIPILKILTLTYFMFDGLGIKYNVP